MPDGMIQFNAAWAQYPSIDIDDIVTDMMNNMAKDLGCNLNFKSTEDSAHQAAGQP